MRTLYKLICIGVMLACGGLLPRVAAAQQAPAAPPPGISCATDALCQIGPYAVRVSFDRDNFTTTDTATVTVDRVGTQTDAWTLKAEILPDAKTSATPVQFSGDWQTGSAATRRIPLNFPISGQWYLHLTVSGAAGKGDLHTPVYVAPPPKMADQLAWLIGLAPLLGLAGFAYGQWRLVRQRQRTERLAETAA